MRIIVTGVPGTGKTTLARQIGKQLKIPVFSDKKIAQQAGAWSKDGTDFVVDIPIFQRALKNHFKTHPLGVWEGHLLSEVSYPSKSVQLLVLLETDPQILIKRLRKRNYSWIKTLDNVWSQEQDHCGLALKKSGFKPIWRVDSTKPIKAVASLVLSRLK